MNAKRLSTGTLSGPVLIILATVGTAGCAAPELRPAAGAQLVAGKDLAAVTETAGVRMVVETDAWSARPQNLDSQLTPVKVTIENSSDQPVRVSYEDFQIETGSGVHYTPLPPLNIRGTVTQTADRPVYYPRYRITPRFVWRDFYIAPWYAPYYTGLPLWSSPWAFSPYYYDTYYPRWTVELPTADMIERAIPEGVIEPGGSLSGFLYFPELEDGLQSVRFRAELLGGKDGRRLGALEIPFDVG